MKPINKHVNIQRKSTDALYDELVIKSAQTRAMLLVGSDTDFSNYHVSVQNNYWGAVLECAEDVDEIVPEILRRQHRTVDSILLENKEVDPSLDGLNVDDLHQDALHELHVEPVMREEGDD